VDSEQVAHDASPPFLIVKSQSKLICNEIEARELNYTVQAFEASPSPCHQSLQ